ncbi:hypothetical protein EVAR_59953_1 [Eumeta japonica]|uniref:Uncharacterized protein n=1 Tax=Eumeta variegata TaxID=151549 RepID=A0A4C1YTW2_EUMVA|nr:hypothetical protein EVAR_59953_1 [Eumeta japonica]
MDAKDLRTDSIDRQRNEFINYEHSDPRTLCSNQNYVDSNAIPKMDVQTSRPCAIIGPDRVVPQSLSNLEFSIRKNCTEWNYKENPVCPSPDHYEKILKHHPLRNISPRQTYQENMQRVMIPPHIDTMKGTDVPTNFTNGRNLTKNSKIHLADPKHIDVPYNVPQTPTEQRNFGNSEMYIPQPAGTTIPPHGWTPSNTMPGRTYPQFSPSNMYRYPEYSNHTSYPVPIAHSHHMIPEESSHLYSNQFYRPGNVRYEPYPSSKDRVQHVRGSCHNKVKLLTDKNIDVRQFFQMWNEGDEENIDGNGTNPPATTDDCIANDAPIKSSSKPDQLYVLDLVTVPTEELGKYEHIEKISKLPDNIKGYNHIELLNQFEKVLGNSNVKYKYLQSTNSNKGLHHTDNKSSQRPLSPLDVEAKISQSVIHKEVGCNFEIKPCSPKALTVDIVAPAQATSIERQIEKVINPHVQSLPLPSTQNDISNDCDLVEEHAQQLKLQLEEPSTCKLTEAHGSDIGIKTNYNLQEFNTNSGVYLASLPRLDNDIEFNFPEVNQQFLDANKMESEVNKSKYTNTVYPLVNETSHKNSLHELQSSAFSESNKVIKETLLIDVKSPIPPDFENAKESTKLSKFRKIKNHVPNVSENSLVKAQCSDSVIARTGDTENIPTLEVDTILNFDESTDDFSAPMNLSSSKSHVIQYVTSVNSIQTVKKIRKRLSENNKSIDPYVIKTDITNNKDFQLDIIGQDINLKSEQDANQNVSFVTKDKTVNTNISTHKILVYCEKQEFINKDIINQENNASINSCDMNFSTESKETSDEIELVASENNIENSNSIQLPFGSPSVQQTKKYNTTTAKCELHMDVDVICGSDIIDIDKPGSKIMISNNSIIKEENKQTSFSGVIEIAHDVQSQGHNEEIKSKIHRSVFRQTFSKEIFSPRIQNLLINSEGIIKKELTSCEISVLTGVSKDVYSEENFIGTESQNIQSVIIPCVQNEVIKSMQENLSEKVANDPIEKQSDIVLELNSSETFGSFNNLPTLINIEENNQMALSDDCNESDNSKTSQFSTSAIHNYGTKDIIVKKSLKCSKCETSCRNYSTPKSRLLSRKLRSLSESDICQYDLEFSNNENSYNKHYLSRQKKTKRDVNLTLDVDNRISVSNNCRRNSIASILNDQNLSVCILIDSDCLITDESLDNVEGNECYSFQEDEEILCSNEDSVSTTVIVPIENDTIQEETMQQNNEADICVDKDYGDFWVDDVGCIETVVSDEIIESNENSLPIFETEKDDMPVEPLETEFGKNFDSAKIKAIYGSNILKSDIKLVESLYKTPQMNVNDKLKRATNSPIQIEDENIPNKTLCVNAQLSTTSTISDKSIKNESESLTVSDLDICRKNISDNHTMKYDYHKKISHSLSTSIEKYLTQSEDDYESDSSNVFPNKSSTSLVQRHINLLPTMEISNPIQINSFNTSASSSPEVSSTTSEEKSNILLKICKYDTSIATCIKPENESEFFKKGLRCKLTEVNHYGKPGHSSNSFKPLITKAAQKYIPPPKGTDNNLKIKLPLSEHRLEKLKRLKISKDIPKLKNNDFICSRDMESSKKKPNFEDVLRSIDEVQYKLHKSKCKIKQTIPKVVIKKNENGSHYASTSKMYNPDLTGRKWQPWVFLEKNYFIDKMALKKNTKAIYCHKRDTYVIADKIGNNKKDEPSGTSTKLIISRPKVKTINSDLYYQQPMRLTQELKKTAGIDQQKGCGFFTIMTPDHTHF